MLTLDPQRRDRGRRRDRISLSKRVMCAAFVHGDDPIHDHGSGERGFSLVEATVVVAILAISMGIIVPSVMNLGVSELHEKAGKLAGTIRATYDAAALGGTVHRIVLDLASHTIEVEQAPSLIDFGGEGGALRAAEEELEARRGNTDNPAPFLGDIDLAAAMESVVLPSSTGEQMATGGGMAAFLNMGALGGTGGSGAFSGIGKSLPLDDIRVVDVWLEGMREAETEGKQYLYFFPGGYTQNAVINLTDGNQRYVGLRVQALTGKVSIEPERMEPPK